MVISSHDNPVNEPLTLTTRNVTTASPEFGCSFCYVLPKKQSKAAAGSALYSLIAPTHHSDTARSGGRSHTTNRHTRRQRRSTKTE